MQLLNKELLDQITEKAQASPRLRMNHNLHRHLDSQAQRLFNALEPGTVLPIHRHRLSDETYILIRGCLNVLLYDDQGNLTESVTLDSLTDTFGVHIPAGTWHTVDVLEPGTVIFEVKDGPYMPLGEEDVMTLK